MHDNIRLVKPYIKYEDIEENLKEIFASGVFTKGNYSKLLPQMLCNYLDVEHAFLATSATTALWMCLKLLRIGPGDEVIVSDFSFPASANVVEDLGATTVLADVSLETYNMLPDELERKISINTKAVIFVDALGNPSGLTQIAAICKKHKVPLIEDAACAFGSSIGDKKVGSIADFSCFSMHPRKLLTTGEGGAITTNNNKYAEQLLIKLNHGANAQGEYVSFGYNFRMPEIACLMGCKEIESIDEVIAQRRSQYALYEERLTPLGFAAQKEAQDAYSNRQSVVFSVPKATKRDDLIAALSQEGIESTLGTYCLSDCEYYRNKYQAVQPNALWLQNNTITLPCYSGLDIEAVCNTITNIIEK